MASETVVAVFDTAAHAEAAVAALIADGVPESSIEHYSRDAALGTDIDTAAGAATGTTATATGTGATSHGHRGFWAWLTGESETTSEHHALYDRSIQSGGTVVTVISSGNNIDQIYNVLEAHNPVDLDERHSQYQQTGAHGTAAGGATSTAFGAVDQGMPASASSSYDDGTGVTGVAGTTAGTAGLTGATASGIGTTGIGTAGTATTGTEEVIPLSEESLQVGKREVDRGTTRVRRYVVERPIDEQIRLRNETVSIYRRAPTSASIGADAFRDREIVVNETDEEAVVAKTARVVEEVVVQKGVEERVENVHDTVRKEEVEIDGPSAGSVASPTVPPRT